MSFLSGFKFFGKQDELFDKNGFLIVMNIFADKVFALVLENGKETQIKAYIEEQIEESELADLDFEKLKLNCAKAKGALFKKGFKSSNVIFTFSPELAQTRLLKKKFARESAEEKISKSDIDGMVALAKEEYHTQKEFLFLDNLERVLIDGYAIADPVGMNGKELELDILGVSYKEDLEKQFRDLAHFLKLDLKKVLSMDKEYVKGMVKKKELKEGVFINIFENLTSVFLLRNGGVTALDTVGAGYGAFDLKIAKELGVGREEAKAIKRSFASGNLDVSVIDKARELAVSSAGDLLYKTKLSLGLIDKENLLPSDIFISFFGDSFLQAEQVFSKGNKWFSDLPISQNANIYFLSPKDISENLITGLENRQYSYVYVIIQSIKNF